jgi:hypothetical protein
MRRQRIGSAGKFPLSQSRRCEGTLWRRYLAGGSSVIAWERKPTLPDSSEMRARSKVGDSFEQKNKGEPA